MSCTPVISRTWKTFICKFAIAIALLAAGISSAIVSAATREYPNVPLINQDGETLHFYDDIVKGKVVSINFMFTSCPDSCPLETAKLRELQRLLGDHAGKDVYMFSISVDPDRDTPEALKAYMKKFNVGPGWQFLTGKKSDIDLIRHTLGMYNDDEQELSDHNINFIIGSDFTGRWMKRTPFDIPEALMTTLLGSRMQRVSLLTNKPSYAETKKLSASLRGEDTYQTRCMACHTIGQGDKSGPDLFDIASRRDHDWLVRWITEPDAMLKEKDPVATALYEQYNRLQMPNLRLSKDEAEDVISLITEVSKRLSGKSKQQITGMNDDETAHEHKHVH